MGVLIAGLGTYSFAMWVTWMIGDSLDGDAFVDPLGRFA